MEIKVLGTGCPKCQQLENKIRETVYQHGFEAEITKVDDMMDIMAYGITRTPGFVINENVITAVRIPTEKEIVKALELNQKN